MSEIETPVNAPPADWRQAARAFFDARGFAPGPSRLGRNAPARTGERGWSLPRAPPCGPAGFCLPSRDRLESR